MELARDHLANQGVKPQVAIVIPYRVKPDLSGYELLAIRHEFHDYLRAITLDGDTTVSDQVKYYFAQWTSGMTVVKVVISSKQASKSGACLGIVQVMVVVGSDCELHPLAIPRGVPSVTANVASCGIISLHPVHRILELGVRKCFEPSPAGRGGLTTIPAFDSPLRL